MNYCYMVIDDTSPLALPLGVFNTAAECAKFLGCHLIYVYYLIRWEISYKGVYRVIKVSLTDT